MTDLAELAQPTGTLLKARGDTVAVSESSTGGLICAALLAIPGASAYFLGGGVIYTLPARRHLLGIREEDMAGMRSASEAYAALCARTVRAKLGATWGLAETGASGPTGNRYGDAAGHSCIAVAGPRQAVLTVATGRSGREDNMWEFTRAALRLFEATVREQAPDERS